MEVPRDCWTASSGTLPRNTLNCNEISTFLKQSMHYLLNNKYFELQLQSQVRTRQHVRAMQQHMPIQHRHTDTDSCGCIFLSLNPSSFGVVPNNLASHAHVIPPSHIDCISVVPDINTIQNAVTCTHTHRSQGHSSRYLAKAEVTLFKYKQRALLETILILFQCMLSFPTRNTASKP